jgi:hypothetical protein
VDTIPVSMRPHCGFGGGVVKGHASSNAEVLPLASSVVVAVRTRLVRLEQYLPDCSRASFWLCCCSLAVWADVCVQAGLGPNSTRLRKGRMGRDICLGR